MSQTDGYPLFLLGNALLPSEQTALHVFEPRYRELAERCLTNDEPFGLVRVDDAGNPSEYGCATRIVEVIERYDDGRLDVLVEGVAPIRLVEIEDRFSYPSAIVETIEPDGRAMLDQDQSKRTREAFEKLLTALGGEVEDAELEDSTSYELAAQLNMDEQDKQALLELHDEDDRMALLERIFSAAVGPAIEARKLAKIAKSNGHAKR